MEGNPHDTHDATVYGEERDLDMKLQDTPLILDSDNSQLHAIRDVIQNGRNLVIEGPPGTGKSQTIANMICAALAKGKTVLFVAEKKAALDVVKRRLDQAGLGDFVLEVHSHRTHKGNLHANIKKRLDGRYDREEKLDKLTAELKAKREQILAHSEAMGKVVGPKGEAIHDIFWLTERFRGQIHGKPLALKVENPLALSAEQLDARIQVLDDVARLWQEVPPDAVKTWQGFRPNALLPGDENSVLEILGTIESSLRAFTEFIRVSNENLSFFDTSIASLRALSSVALTVLAERPKIAEVSQAGNFIGEDQMRLLQELDAAINKYRVSVIDAEPIVRCHPGPLSEIEGLVYATQPLVLSGFGTSTPQNCQVLNSDLFSVNSLVKSLETSLSKLSSFFVDPPLPTMEAFERIASIEKLFEAAPPEISIERYAGHADQAAQQVVQEARNICTEVAEKIEQLSETFNLDFLPPTHEINSQYHELSKYSRALFPFLSPAYQALKRQIQTYLKTGIKFDRKKLAGFLRDLGVTIEKATQLQARQDYRKILGPLYKGHESDWPRIERLVNWSQSLRVAVRSEYVAKEIIEAYEHNRETILRYACKVTEDVKRLKGVCARAKLSFSEDTDIHRLLEKKNPVNLLMTSLNKMLIAMEGYEDLLNISMGDIHKGASAHIEAAKIKKDIADNKRYIEICGPFSRNEETDTQNLMIVAQWVNSLKDRGGFTAKELSWLFDGDYESQKTILIKAVSETVNFINQLDKCSMKLGDLGEFECDQFWGSDANLNKIESKLNACRAQIHYLQRWSDICSAFLTARGMGLEQVVDYVANGQLDSNNCLNVYRHGIYDSMARDLITKEARLRDFTRVTHEGIIERFVSLDRERMSLVRKRIASVVAKRPVPPGNCVGYVRDHTERYLIEKEVHKTRRHIPIRQLMKRAGKALQALKPCFMMSPLSVAQFLEPQYMDFDLVIMDEASQIRPEDALGAIFRGRQVVVVGDSYQLPPTSFFDQVYDDPMEEERTAIQDADSILDICKSTFHKSRLLWHYRSDHPSLIAFSNKQFYDEELIVFPSSKKGTCGVFSHFVNGATYKKSRNIKEAEAVIAGVVDHFRRNPNLSLGVAAMNREQADLIEEILERTRKEDAWLDEKLKESDVQPEPIFIKNLENVQGDERDVIFISTTFGPDPEHGKVYQRFGPIGGDTGWRRLNVLFTRARKRIDLFTSMKPVDVIPAPGSSRGVHDLKAYLEYAETGTLPDRGSIYDEREPQSDFEVSVINILNNYGFKSVPQVGVAGFFIDIGVKHPERLNEFVLGVECDGATYHSHKNVRDRDRLRQEILEKKGWKIHRIWSTDWIKNREVEIKRLLEAIRNILGRDKSIVSVESCPVPMREEPLVQMSRPSHQTVAKQSAMKSLEGALLEYKRNNIVPVFSDDSQGILRPEMITLFVEKKPTVRDEFYQAIPMSLRQKTDGKQMQFLDDILEIIGEYS